MKKDNSLRKGISFLITNIIKKEPLLLVMVTLCVLLTLASSVLLVYIPSYAVAVIDGNPAAPLLRNLILITVIYIAVSVLCGGVQSGRGMRQLYMGRNLLYRLFLRRLEARYEYTESDAGQKAYEKARQVCLWGADVRQLLEGLMSLIVCIVSFAIYAGLLSRLTPVLVIGLAGLSALNYFTMKRTQKANDKRMDEQAAEMRKYFYLINAFQNTKIGKDIRLYRMSEWLCTVMDKSLRKLREIHNEFQSRILCSRAVASGAAFLRDGIAYGYLIYQVCNHNISISEFVLYFGIINQLTGFVSNCIQSYGTLCMGCAGISAVSDYFSDTEEPERDDKSSSTTDSAPNVSIELRDVCFSYDGEHNILDHISLTIHAGEKLALVGTNGAGKTTLVKLLCGLYKPQSGQILLNGQPAEELTFTERADRIGAVFQDCLILPYSIAENISMAPYEKTDIPRVEDCLKQVGLYETVEKASSGLRTQMTRAVDDKGIELSGGQQQKLLMARMLYRPNASLWVLDEPTAALDALAESETYSFFHALCGDRTCIYISHRLASTRFLDRIILLDEGRIAEEGTHEELLRNHGKYAHLFEIQSKYYQEENANEAS